VINLSVCLSVRELILEPLDRCSGSVVCRSPVAVARSSSGGVALCYVLLVLWIMLCMAIMGCMSLRGRPDLLVAISYVRDRGGV